MGRNILTKCPVNIADVNSTDEIFGPYKGSLRRKIARTKSWEVKYIHVNLPMELIAKYQSVILFADYMFVNRILFLNTYSCDIRFITSRYQEPNTDMTMQAMRLIKAYYAKRGFNIVEIRVDQNFFSE